MAPPAVTVLPSPKRLVAKLKIDPELVVAVELPTTKAAPNNPSAWASAPSPMAREPLNNVLVQSGLLPIPKIDAQVAFAVGANPNPVAPTPKATANAPTRLMYRSYPVVLTEPTLPAKFDVDANGVCA